MATERNVFRVDDKRHQAGKIAKAAAAVVALGAVAGVTGCGTGEHAPTTTNPPVLTPSPTTEIPSDLKCPEGLPAPKIDSTGLAENRINFVPENNVITVTIKDLIKEEGGCVEQLIGNHWQTRVPREKRDELINGLNESGEAKASTVGTGKYD